MIHALKSLQKRGEGHFKVEVFMKNNVNLKIVSQKEVVEIIGLCRSTIQRSRKKGSFPRAYQISERRIGFRLDEIHRWVETRRGA